MARRRGHKIRRRKRIAAKLDITPMIDIIFQLVIFFLITTTFKVSGGVNVNLPETETRDTVASQDVIILIDNEGVIFVNNIQVTMDDIDDALEDQIGLGMDTVIFKIDKEVDHGLVVRVMDRARLAGLENMLFATELVMEEDGPDTVETENEGSR